MGDHARHNDDDNRADPHPTAGTTQPAPLAPPPPVVPPTPEAMAESPAMPPPPPAAPPAPPAAPPATGSTPSPAQTDTTLRPLLTPRVLLGALAHVGIVLGATLLGAAALLVLLGLLSSSDAGTASFGPAGDLGDLLDGVGAIVALLFTFAAAILGGELTVSLGGSSGMFSAAATGSVWVFPLTLTAGVLAAALWWGVRQGRSNPLATHLNRAAYGFGVGLITGIVLLLLALIFAVRFEGPGVQLQVTAAGYRVVLFSTLLVGLAAYLGREAGALSQPRETWITAVWGLLQASPRAVREWLTYSAFGAVLFGVVGAVYVTVDMWGDVGAASLGIAAVGTLNVAALVAALAHLGGIAAGGGFSGATSESSTVTVFTADSPILWLAVLAAVLLAVFVALWIGTRRPRTERVEVRTAWQLPVLVGASWLLLGPVFFGAGIGAQGGAGVFGGAIDAGIGVALWTAAVMLVWAALVELGAQTLPRLAYGALPQVHGALVGRRALDTWVAGAPAFAAVPAGHHAGAAMYSETPTAPAGLAPLDAPKPLSQGAKRGLIIGAIGAGALIAVAVVGSVVIGIVNGTRSPEAVAKEYLEHLAAGRAEAANALSDPNVPNAARQFLTDEVLGSATERITDISVNGEESNGDKAFVSVSYKLDGVTREAGLEVEKGEPEWLVLDTWRLTSSLATETAFWADGAGEVSIDGVPIEGDDGQASAVLYPGVYELSTDGSEYYELDDARLIVEAGVIGTKELQFAPTDALRSEVAAQVDARLKKCVASTAADPDGCPFSVFTYNDDTTVTWALKEDPTVAISDNGANFQAEGVAVGSYTEDFFGTIREREDEDRYSIYGEIAVEGSEVTVSFDDTWW